MEIETNIYFRPIVPTATNKWSGGWPQSREEFSRFVDAYLPQLVRYAFCRLYNLSDAEDVVQEVFIRAYTDRKKRVKITNPGPYLYKMTANACTSHLRTHKRSKELLNTIKKETNSNGIPDPSQYTAAREELDRADELIHQLPKEQAEVVRLRVFDRLQLNEIAEIVGCSLNTVSSRLRYGFKKLRGIVTRQRRNGI
jgi:RNA polymerase sigma-70 factor (ECF subfamily)